MENPRRVGGAGSVFEDLAAPAELCARAEAGGPEALDAEALLQLVLLRRAGPAAAGFAGRLLARFGSLPEVLGAPEPELAAAAGPRAAREIRLLHVLMVRALREPFRQRPVLASSAAVAAWLRAAMAALPREEFRVLFLDRRNRLIADEVMGRGSVGHAPAYPREVARRALELSASAVVLAHNHPSGDPTPSSADVTLTAEIVAACRPLAIAVHDHLVVSGEAVTSFRSLGLLP
jgi:DNA repair protein RadC